MLADTTGQQVVVGSQWFVGIDGQGWIGAMATDSFHVDSGPTIRKIGTTISPIRNDLGVQSLFDTEVMCDGVLPQ